LLATRSQMLQQGHGRALQAFDASKRRDIPNHQRLHLSLGLYREPIGQSNALAKFSSFESGPNTRKLLHRRSQQRKQEAVVQARLTSESLQASMIRET
jgi:hypothetical protein